MTKPALTILLASPRGFCAGVDRAIEIVERALVKHGAPVYVRHEIVHNRFVVESLEQKGAIFVQELDEVPEGVPVIFSAHGVPKSVPEAAKARNLLYFDATCPLVSKVHREAERHEKDGRQVILIGHAGHPEVIGTMGQLNDSSIVLVETEQDAEDLLVPDPENLAYVTQTTLSVDDTASIIKILLRRFPNMMGPKQEDICYATTNRQEAVKAISAKCDALLVIGAPNSSNSKRLVEVAFKQGCEKAALVQRATDIQWDRLAGIKTLGITAGASAPEILVEEVIDAFREHFDVRIEEVNIRDEDVVFKVPKTLSDTTANKEIH
ncbi:4-hydroxy-3-methylbut-2-enyl diphosphate reductase [Kiloniella laminariae]|uniref:4-hydroxy-3-methylbut-2-enyl diphosphate reductase n=1 Tax=Kiloniella laminariae TaxID=454162 RepID=UPI0003772A21|nr:4-hydroxy-3-methylbut-2-enyl diphosphate reductase [Kiloniella laminariae]